MPQALRSVLNSFQIFFLVSLYVLLMVLDVSLYLSQAAFIAFPLASLSLMPQAAISSAFLVSRVDFVELEKLSNAVISAVSLLSTAFCMQTVWTVAAALLVGLYFEQIQIKH